MSGKLLEGGETLAASRHGPSTPLRKRRRRSTSRAIRPLAPTASSSASHNQSTASTHQGWLNVVPRSPQLPHAPLPPSFAYGGPAGPTNDGGANSSLRTAVPTSFVEGMSSLAQRTHFAFSPDINAYSKAAPSRGLPPGHALVPLPSPRRFVDLSTFELGPSDSDQSALNHALSTQVIPGGPTRFLPPADAQVTSAPHLQQHQQQHYTDSASPYPGGCRSRVGLPEPAGSPVHGSPAQGPNSQVDFAYHAHFQHLASFPQPPALPPPFASSWATEPPASCNLVTGTPARNLDHHHRPGGHGPSLTGLSPPFAQFPWSGPPAFEPLQDIPSSAYPLSAEPPTTCPASYDIGLPVSSNSHLSHTQSHPPLVSHTAYLGLGTSFDSMGSCLSSGQVVRNSGVTTSESSRNLILEKRDAESAVNQPPRHLASPEFQQSPPLGRGDGVTVAKCVLSPASTTFSWQDVGGQAESVVNPATARPGDEADSEPGFVKLENVHPRPQSPRTTSALSAFARPPSPAYDVPPPARATVFPVVGNDVVSLNGRKQRRRFNEVDRLGTSNTRKWGTCIRCSAQRKRCKPNPRDPHNPEAMCDTCYKVGWASNKITKIDVHCVRWKLTHIELFRPPDLRQTERWVNDTKLHDVGDWADNTIHIIQLHQTLCSNRFSMDVRRFRPRPGDKLHRNYTVRGDVRRFALPPYALADARTTADKFLKYIRGNAVQVLECAAKDASQVIHPIVRRTLIMAHEHCQELEKRGQDDEKALMSEAAILWFAIRHSTGSALIAAGHEKLGIKPITDPECPERLRHTASLPRMILEQMDRLAFNRVLKPLSQYLLPRLDKACKSSNPSCWFTVYLVTFLFLYEVSHVSADRFRHARENNSEKPYTLGYFVESLQFGANVILAFFMYYKSKVDMSRLTPQVLDEEPLASSGMSQRQKEYLLWVGRELQNGDAAKEVKAAWEGRDYNHDLYFAAQMFEKAWKPRAYHNE